MTGINRLASPHGRLVDRSREIEFTFEGQAFTGLAGDTIASALAANDAWILSRSFKYHRPRGILTMAGMDANTLVQVGDEPSVLADRRLISDGLSVTGQNYVGSLFNDRDAWMDRIGRFLPVGFYYKAFYKPKGAWKRWEPYIRRKAGLGVVNTAAHHGYFDKQYLFADVAVIGGGPAGIAAALEAAKGGGEVILIDENAALGGSLTYARFDASGQRGLRQAAELTTALPAAGNIRVMTGTTCNGLFSDSWLALVKGTRLYKLRAKSVVIATGSLEQPAVFRHNDLPGVMMGSAAQRLIRHYGIRPGRRAVVLTANSDGYGVALDLAEAGVQLQAIVDLRTDTGTSETVTAVNELGVPILTGCTVSEMMHSQGKHHITAALISRITGEGTCEKAARTIECDLLCMSVGYTPTSHLLHHLNAKFAYNKSTAMFEVASLPAHVIAAGSVAGTYNLDAVIQDGRRAGWLAARDAGLKSEGEPAAPASKGNLGVTHPWPIFNHPKGRDFVDFDEDLQVKDLKNGAADGYDDIELLKRYSTVGMGPSQGKHSAVTAARVLAKETGRDLASLSVTTQRPPFVPEKIGLLGGRVFDPERRTAMHHRHLELGARMMPAGVWWRPAYYGRKEDREQAITAEVKNVRENVGLIDVSTLGGLDIRGPDAAEFINRMYTFSYAKLPVGKSRYVLMTDQSGAVIDDGVACRFHDEHFYVTATTSGVDGVYRLMLFWNAQWRLDVDVANVTAAYAGVNIAGPRARQVLQRLCNDVDLSAEAFPYLGVRMGTVAGVPARLLRVGFVGELGYEIHMPAHYGEHVWDALMEAGQPFNIKPFGVEAQRVLRLEKGHIIIGQDTDGLTHPYEADMAWAVSKAKPYFMGQKSIEIQNARGLTRKLVGFTIDDPAAPVPEECHLTLRGDTIVGRVTSAVRSLSLGRIVGLAYVAPEQAAAGSSFDIKVDGGRIIQGKVVPIPFYDPKNQRQEM
ncbi:MAG TPA: 2Fe-2S iron-sulfur cluster-binding protein [Verrucomicrobiae bacterium]|nr:2Fe-2S iron-sulfur cluster-binding protein [Verrucomicrobiae bacterium]